MREKAAEGLWMREGECRAGKDAGVCACGRQQGGHTLEGLCAQEKR